MNPIVIDFSFARLDEIKEGLKETQKQVASFKPDWPFLDLPFGQEKVVEEITKVSDSVRYRFKNLVVLGIGGSALGLKTLVQGLLPPLFNWLDSKDRKGSPTLFVCDNIDPDHFGALLKYLDFKETFVNVVSKSGNTTETISQFYIIKDILIKKLGAKKWKEHVVITTDPTDGPLRIIATLEHLQSFTVPERIGGRFSVLTPVALFPAACVGIDVKGLLNGAAEMTKRCSVPALDENPAYKNGAIHYLMHTLKKRPISVIMPYSDSLSLFSDWYAQLWAESLGKDGDGPTPVKALGATDQHSQLQLYMEGPDDKVITFVGVENFATKLRIPTDIAKNFSYLAGQDLGRVLQAEQTATARALYEAGRPVISITLPNISAHTLGGLLMMYQIQTAFTGHLYGINPFDQPGVELGKKLTREILSGK